MRKFIVLACVAMLSACASIEERPATVQLVTQYSVLKYSERFPEAERAIRMQRVRDIATTVKAVATGETTLPLLQQAVATQLDRAGLSPADRLLADGLVQILVAELKARMGTGLLSPDQLVQVSAVLDWVIAATHMA